MDVRDTLAIEIPYIVDCIFHNVENNPILLIESLYNMVTENISINFDSKNFYLTRYETRERTKLYFPLNKPSTPTRLVRMVLGLIRLGRMKQNIKNSDYLIHFRVFHDKVFLEDTSNTLRVRAFLEADRLIAPSMGAGYTASFLMSKLTKLRHRCVADSDVTDTVLIQRVIVIVSAVIERIHRESDSDFWCAKTQETLPAQ